jgi:hypothetical protein
MQAMSMFGGSEFAVLLMFFGGAGVLPLGAPPEKENPVMAYVAPDDCVLYATWAGMAVPNSASPNQTEQLLAEPEVQQFAAAVEKAVATWMSQAARAGEDDPRNAAAAKSGPVWVRSLITRPAAFYLSKLEPRGQSLAVEGGMIVQAGDSAALLDSTLTTLFTSEDQKPVEFTLGSRKFHKLAATPELPVELSWGAGNGYLMVGFGEGALAAMSERIRGQKTPTWLTKLQADAAIERRSTQSYINAKKLIDSFAPLTGPEGESVIASLGLRQVGTIGSVTGMDDTGMVSKTLMTIDGPPRGLLSLLESEGIVASDLAHVPTDALVASTVSLEASKLLDVVLAAAAEADPRAAGEINAELVRFEERTGVNLRDALGGLGNNWSLHAATADGGLMGAAATVEVWDRAKVAAAQTAIMSSASEIAGPGQWQYVKTPFAGQSIFHLASPGMPMPFAPAWCLTDKQLIVGLYPQSVKAVLARRAGEKSLADVPEVAAVMAGPKPPLAISYYDTKPMFEATYSYLQMLAPMLLQQTGMQFAGRAGGEPPILFDPAMLPTARSISRHLRPSVTVVRRTPAGVSVETRQTLPVTNIGAMAPVGVALLLPAVQAARGAAAQTEASNNLKHQMLAIHNFHDTFTRMPAAYSVDEAGKPLLSWRVHILPFIEEKALYDQFKLDEPWDSEHNKTLIAKMPKVYRAPGSKAGEGKTVYLGVGGTRGVIIKPTGRGHDRSPYDGTSFAAITDGTSNTLAIVEANDAAAVVWTKPEEWTPDAKEPLKNVVGLRPKGFLAAMCDGSVRVIPPTVTAENLLRMFDRSDGNVIDWGEARPAPRRALPVPVPLPR